MKIGFSKYYPAVTIILWTVACWWFFQFRYAYHFFFQEQNQLFLWSWDYIATYFTPGGAALLIGDFLTQFYYYLFAGAAILSLCLLIGGWLLYSALRNFHVSTIIALMLSLALMTFMAVCHFTNSYRLSSTISIMGWTMLLWLVSLMRNWKFRLGLLVVGILPTYFLFGLPKIKHIQKPDFLLEKDFAADCEYYFGNEDIDKL